MLTVGSLFAGIGGFDLGFERAGMRTVWFCEQDPFCQRVLAKHWPGVPCHPDVRTLVADTGRGGVQRDGGPGDLAGPPGGVEGEGDQRERDGNTVGDGGPAWLPVPVPYVDVLCGGFPCQDISLAGRGAGIGGSRSGLWGEFARLIGELRPRYVVVENVPAITSRGLDVVLSDLAACGFDAEWDHLPAAAFGAPHRRDRFWLVAYPHKRDEPYGPVDAEAPRDGDAPRRSLAHSNGKVGGPAGGAGEALPRSGEVERFGRRGGSNGDHWEFEPAVGRVAYGVPSRVDRLRALGNSLVPQIAEWIGRRIVTWEEQR